MNKKPKYIHKSEDAIQISKHGIDLTIFPTDVATANVVHVSVKEGHFQEFYDKKSTYIYYIIEGEGVFVLNDEKIPARAGDLVVIPRETRIHYFGKMKMTLTVTPAFDEDNEVHVRFLEKDESPYYRSDKNTGITY